MSNGLEPIKNWSMKHEMIVHLHIGQWSNKAIAEHVGMSEVRVSQVLNDQHAKAIIRATRLRLRKQMEENIEDRLVRAAEKSIERVEETLDAGFELGSDAKKHQDNISMGILKGVGFFPGARDDDGRDQRPSLSGSLAERLITALDKSNEAAQLHSGKLKDGVIEVEAEVVEDGEPEDQEEDEKVYSEII